LIGWLATEFKAKFGFCTESGCSYVLERGITSIEDLQIENCLAIFIRTKKQCWE